MPWLKSGAEPELPFEERDTSRAAAEAIEPSAGSLRGMVLDLIRYRGNATDDEIESELDLRHQTASARRRELVLGGLIFDSGLRRKTRSGRNAIVWVAR